MGERIKKSRVSLSSALFVFLILLSLCAEGISKDKNLITVSLKRNEENRSQGGAYSIKFDKEEVQATLKKRPLNFPSQLSQKAQIGLTLDKIYVATEKLPKQKVIRLTIDCNQNDDLMDDNPIEIKEGGYQTVKILRRYTTPGEKEVWLPYKVFYKKRKTPDGNLVVRISVMANFRMEGYIKINRNEYFMTLDDDHYIDGKFDRKDLERGTCLYIDINKDGQIRGREESFYGYDLIPLGEKFYVVREVAEDGSTITFAQSDLWAAEVGKEAHDFLLTDIEGKRFWIHEKRGKVVLLNFWASWFKPCVAKFPAVKKLAEQYKDSLTIIGISIDDESRLKNALEIIEDYKLPWIQVVERKGPYSPISQVYGRIGDSNAIPLYVIIDPSGIIRYGGRNMYEIEAVLYKLIKKSPEFRYSREQSVYLD